MDAFNKEKIDKAEKQLIERILFSLSQNNIPWRKSWGNYNYLMVNALNNNIYQGRNQMILQWTASALNFDDPRWLTFKQAKEKGYKIKKGSIGTSIIFTSMRDPKTNKNVTAEYLKSLSEEDALDIKKRCKTYKKSFVVFNGNQVEGLPQLEEKQKIVRIFENKTAEEFLNTTIKNMKISITEGMDPYYNVKGDYLSLPLKEMFDNEISFYATAFHEIAHASGSTNRLNRDLSGKFGTTEYAREELIAELTSAILAIDTGFVLENDSEEQYAAYCSSWYKFIKEEGAFYNCLNNAQLARKYIHQVGEYQRILENQVKLNRENKEVSIDVLKSSISIVEYAKEIGLTPIKESKGLYRLHEHDSCKIYPTNTFYRFSSGRGGSIIDFISEFENVDISEAIQKAKEYYYQYNPEELKLDSATKTKSSTSEIELPAKGMNNKKVINYLSKRGINGDVIDQYLKRKMLYQDENQNCVFVGYYDKKPMYATRRGTMGNFKQDLSTFSEVGIFYDNKSKSLVLTESVIDQMSYQCLDQNADEKSYLSTNGTAKALGALNFHLTKRDENVEEVIIAFDNDVSGEKASNEIIEWLNENYPEIVKYRHTPDHKDFNEDLCFLVRNDAVSIGKSVEEFDDQQVYMENNMLIDFEGDA